MESTEYRYETQILFTTFNSGTIHDAKEFLDICSVISEKAKYKFWPGLNVDHYYEYPCHHKIIHGKLLCVGS